MDIAGLSMALSANKIQTEVGVAMLKKSMDSMEQAGATVADLVESAPAPADPNLGANIDIRL